MKEFNEKGFLAFALILIAAIAVFSSALFGLTGARVVFGIILVSVPFYFILGSFGLAEGEKIVFSVLSGLTIFPSLVYILGFLISFRISIIMAFIILIGLALLLHKYRKSWKIRFFEKFT